MSDAVLITLIITGAIMIVFFVLVFMFRERITGISLAVREGKIDLTLAEPEKEMAQQNLTRAEQSKEQGEEADQGRQEAAKNKIAELERKIPKTVLWVDDHPTNNYYEIETLRPLGFQVIQVKSNAEAYKEIDANRPDLVITDVGRDSQMTNGLDLVSALAEMKPGLPTLIYTSSSAVRGLRDQALERGAREVTANPSELVQLVIDYLK